MDRIITADRLAEIMAGLPDADAKSDGDGLIVPWRPRIIKFYGDNDPLPSPGTEEWEWDHWIGQALFKVRAVERNGAKQHIWVYEGKVANKEIDNG